MYRLLLNGAKKATPKPPLVRASKRPWDRVDKHKNPNSTRRLWGAEGVCTTTGSNQARQAPRGRAKSME